MPVYHAILDHPGLKPNHGPHYFWNHSEDGVLSNLVVPFVTGQIVFLPAGERKILFNMKAATVLRVFRTDEYFTETDDSKIIEKMSAPSFGANECTQEIIGVAQAEGGSTEVSSLIEKALQPARDQVFVIMKFGDPILDSAYHGAYRTVAAEFGLECLRIDEVQDSGKITDQILENIAESKYVLSDLSGGRPNCYYETGFAHALGKEIVLLANRREKIHFDLQGHRFIQWSTEEELRRKLRERFTAMEASRGTS